MHKTSMPWDCNNPSRPLLNRLQSAVPIYGRVHAVHRIPETSAPTALSPGRQLLPSGPAPAAPPTQANSVTIAVNRHQQVMFVTVATNAGGNRKIPLSRLNSALNAAMFSMIMTRHNLILNTKAMNKAIYN